MNFCVFDRNIKILVISLCITFDFKGCFSALEIFLLHKMLKIKLRRKMK